MSKGVTASGKEYTVTHQFSNGVERDDVTGIVIPVNKYTEVSYKMMIDFALRNPNLYVDNKQ